MKAYLLPFGDLISWCLMPNHFHWQFWVKNVEIERIVFRKHIDDIEFLRRQKKYGAKAVPSESSKKRTAPPQSTVNLNEAIAILQRTYTRALNKEKGWSGSLFRHECKAKDGWINEFVTANSKNPLNSYKFQLGNDFAFQCMTYIHNNPRKANLVKLSTDYCYSSAKDYAGLRKGTLCNLEMGRKIIENIV